MCKRKFLRVWLTKSPRRANMYLTDLYDGFFCLDMMFDLAAVKAKTERK